VLSPDCVSFQNYEYTVRPLEPMEFGRKVRLLVPLSDLVDLPMEEARADTAALREVINDEWKVTE